MTLKEVQKIAPLLSSLPLLTENQIKVLLSGKAGLKFVQTCVEICNNISITGAIPINTLERKKLKVHYKILLKIADTRLNLTQKQRLLVKNQKLLLLVASIITKHV